MLKPRIDKKITFSRFEQIACCHTETYNRYISHLRQSPVM
jgi:hypothetical protein